MSANKKKITVLLAIAGLIIIGLWLRIAAFPKDGMWFDELYSVWAASGDFPIGILQRLWEDDAHAPLYHYILHFFMKFFGTSDFAFMMFNTVISIFAIPVTYLLGVEVAGGKKNENAYKIGLLSALLLTFNYFHICFSNETRFYSLTALFLTLTTMLFFRLINNGYKRSDIAAIIVLNTLMCYTATQGCLYVFTQALVFGFYFLFNKRELIKPLVIASFTTALLFVPYIPFVYHQFWTSQNSFLGAYAHANPEFDYLIEAFYNWFAVNPMIYIGVKQFRELGTDYNFARLLLYILEVALFVMFMFKSITLKDKKSKLLFYVLSAFCLFHVLSYLVHLSPFMPRYLLTFVLFFAVCYANVLLALKRQWLAKLIIIMTIVPGIVAMPMGISKSQFALKGRYSNAIKALDEFNLTSDDIIYKSHSAKLLPPKGVKATPIDVCHNATFLFYNPRRLHMIFGDDYLKYNTKEERENYIEDYIFDPEININNRNYYNEQIVNLKKGNHFVLWVPATDWEYEEFAKDYQGFKNQPREMKKEIVRDFTPKKDYYRYLSAKIDSDYFKLAKQDKRLKLVDVHSEIASGIFLFKKVGD